VREQTFGLKPVVWETMRPEPAGRLGDKSGRARAGILARPMSQTRDMGHPLWWLGPDVGHPPDTLMTGTGPVPAKIPTAKRLYVALDSQNSSFDPTSLIAPFSAALQASGHYVITSTPQDADLTLEVAFDGVMVVRIFEPATQQLLWTLSDPTRNMDPKGNKGHLQREVDGVAAAFEALGKIQ
jgi:hypothetical protein